MPSSQKLTVSVSLGTTHPDSTRWEAFGNSLADSVSFRFPSWWSLAGSRSSCNLGGLVSRPLVNCEAKHTEYSQPPKSFG